MIKIKASPMVLATIGIGLSIASLLVPWFSFQRDKATPLIVEPVLGFTANGHVEKRPWWGGLPPEGGTCYHLRASRTVVYDSYLSNPEIALVRWGGRVASLLTFLDILAWMGLFGEWMGRHRLEPWAALLSIFACISVTLFVPCSVIFSVGGNACLGGRKVVRLGGSERIALQGVNLLRAGPLLLALGTVLEVIAIVLTVWARRVPTSAR